MSKATHLFWRKGYEATSIADLTAAIGIGAPSLYAAFGSKEALYAEALEHYGESFQGLVWNGFFAAATAREAVAALLWDSAAVLTRTCDTPNGCMVTLSTIGSEGNSNLNELVRSARAQGFQRLQARLERGRAEGEIPSSVDIHAIARFIQTVQSGMSILARDGAGRGELEAVADVAMLGWDARTGKIALTES